MQFFTYRNTTELLFGREAEARVAPLLVRECAARRAMLIYGGGSAVRSGLIARVTKSAQDAGLDLVVCPGVRPNPTIEFVRECLAKARDTGVDAVLAVGGGSVIDTAKTVAAAIRYSGDPWDFFEKKAEPTDVLPIGVVLTIPAAGSEQSIRAVVSNGEKKCGMGNTLIRPRVSAINPEIFFTLPAQQVSAGVFDMMSHIMERYFTKTPGVDFTSEEAEAALRVIMRNALKLVDNPQDYEAWSEVSLAGSFAHNGFFGLGHEEDWACHGIEHALSGWKSTITHGAGLAVLTPAWMRFVWPECPARFVRFATEVMHVKDQEDTEQTIQMGIAKLCGFIQRMGLPCRLSELECEAVPLEHIAELAVPAGTLGHLRELTREDVKTILESVL